MKPLTSRVVLITGASSGIGRACAIHLSQRDYRVYGTSRRIQAESMTLDAGSSGFTMIQMDVDDSSSVERGIDRILNVDGRLDVIVNNARIALAGAVGDAVWLKPFIPARLFEWAVMKYYRLH